MRFSRTLLVVTATGILTAVSSCRDIVSPPPVATISLSSNSVELVPSETVQLGATPKDQAGNTLTRPVNWSTSAASVATVDNGLITARGTGAATVTAESDGIKAEVAVSVADGGIILPAGSQISALGGMVELEAGSGSVTQPARITISAAVTFSANTRLIPGTAVELRTQGDLGQSAVLVIRYDPTRILGAPEPGLRLYRATATDWQQVPGSTVDLTSKTVQGKISTGGVYAIFAQANVGSVTVVPATSTIRVGDAVPFSATVKDQDGNQLNNRVVTWSSSAPDVVQIDSSTGAALAKSPGSAKVTANSEGKQGSATISVTTGSAANIAVVAGDGQTADMSSSLAVAPSVKVTDKSGFAVQGAVVTFAVVSGGGSVSPATVATGADGVAAAEKWILGKVAGTNTVTATIETGAAVTFSATATQPPPPSPPPAPPGPTLVPTTIVIAAGNGQSALALTEVPIRPAARVTTASGVPVPGVTVTFSIRSGGGSVTGAVATTDSSGTATVGSWKLGPPGGNSLFATANGLSGSPLIYIATATSTPPPTDTTTAPPSGSTAGPPVAMVIYAGDGQNVKTNLPVPIAPAVKVTDAAGVGVPGVVVVFSIRSGGGSISGENAVTNAQGIATLGQWVMGPPGGQSLFATKAGLTGSPLIFVATSQAGVRIVTFGDSNTDAGWSGTNSTVIATSYVSSEGPRAPPAQNNSTQLAGKIEAQWRAASAVTITAINHGISGTTSGAGRTTLTAPNSRETVGGVTRFEAEVLGKGFPWDGGETGTTYPYGSIKRMGAYIPGPDDFVYVSIGTNDSNDGLGADQSAANINWMIDQWIAAGHSVDHFILTTLAPRPSTNGAIVLVNEQIRQIVAQRGVFMVDIAQRTSDDDGLTWRSSLDNIGDQLHYSEPVRDWIAQQVVGYMLTKAPR